MLNKIKQTLLTKMIWNKSSQLFKEPEVLLKSYKIYQLKTKKEELSLKMNLKILWIVRKNCIIF